MLDFAIFAKGRADETDRITAVALNFEMKGKRFAFNGYQISILTSYNQEQNATCMVTNEIKNGCGSSIEAVLASNQKRRRVKCRPNFRLEAVTERWQNLFVSHPCRQQVCFRPFH